MSQKTQEGPRDYGRFLALVADGACLSECSAELQRIVGLISSEACSRDEKVTGSFTVKLKITIDPKGHADVGYDILVKEPKKTRPTSLFFVTKGDNLSDEMTRQPKLPVREAPAPRTADVDGEKRPAAREV
jgi:hypothetical protein